MNDDHLAPGFQLFQSRPSSTTDVTTAFTATDRTELTSIFLCNTSGAAATIRIFHDDDGSTYDETTALLWDVSVSGDTTIVLEAGEINGGIVISPSGTIGVKPSVASAVTFTGYGVRRRRNIK